MVAEQLLAIDVGTQSTRALVFDLRGNLVAKARVTIEPYYSTAPGNAEQDPEGLLGNALCDACQQVLGMPGVDKGDIAGRCPNHSALDDN